MSRQPSRAGLLALCLLLTNIARLFVTASSFFREAVDAQAQAAYFTADFLSSQFSHEASFHFDSGPCADRVYAGERKRSLRYLFGPTVLKATNYWGYLESKTKALSQPVVVLGVRLYAPFSAGKVYANLEDTSPAADSSLTKDERKLTTGFDAYISMPSPHVDQTASNDPMRVMAMLEIVCFTTASSAKKELMPKVSFIRKQIRKTALLEQGRQIRRQQMLTTYIGKDHTHRTYSQRVLEDSKPRDGEEVYLLRLPEKSCPFCPGSFEDPQWTFELAIKFLTYALPALLKSHDDRSRIRYFSHYLQKSGIIPGISAGLTSQKSEKISPLFDHAFAQSQKYRFLPAKSIASVMAYRESFVGKDLISPPLNRFTEVPSIFLGARRTLLQGNETVICAYAVIGKATKRPPVNLFLLQQLRMPFRIPMGLADETAKRKEALRQLEEMTELNGLEESFDLEARIMSF